MKSLPWKRPSMRWHQVGNEPTSFIFQPPNNPRLESQGLKNPCRRFSSEKDSMISTLCATFVLSVTQWWRFLRILLHHRGTEDTKVAQSQLNWNAPNQTGTLTMLSRESFWRTPQALLPSCKFSESLQLLLALQPQLRWFVCKTWGDPFNDRKTLEMVRKQCGIS